LVRVFERIFRRAGLKLSMSEGFHPKARMSFPSALALGIAGQDEVMDVELAENEATEVIAQKLDALTPPGLIIDEVRKLDASEGKARVERLVYQFPVPESRRDEVADRIDQFLSQLPYSIKREDRKEPIDVGDSLEQLLLEDGFVRIVLRTTPTAAVRPREILMLLGLDDLEAAGHWISRTAVELAP
jgi:radical SAM-linked protein